MVQSMMDLLHPSKLIFGNNMATLMTETEHAAFIAEARLRLTTLKERAAKRARFRGDTVVQPADRDALAGRQPNGGLGERHNDAQTPADVRPAGAALQRLIAAMLLDATTAVPIDSAKLHREVPPAALARRRRHCKHHRVPAPNSDCSRHAADSLLRPNSLLTLLLM